MTKYNLVVDGLPERRFEERSNSISREQSPNVEGIIPIANSMSLSYIPLQLWMIEYDGIASSFLGFYLTNYKISFYYVNEYI